MAYKIIADAMGGDNAPAAMIDGAILAIKDFDVDVILVGDETQIKKRLASSTDEEAKKHLTIIHTTDVIETADDPSTIIRAKKDCSMAVGLRMLAEGKGDAFVSSGNTGAVLTGATLIVKRIRGIRRAALAPMLPSAKGGTLLIDCGANIDCSPEYLLQFAYLGSYYVKKVVGRKNPTVGLLNIGAEETKGDELHIGAHKLLKKAADANRLSFVGNVEAREVTDGPCDVLVSDGFSGNVLMKGIEGTALYVSGLMKKMLMKNAFSKLAALILKSGIGEMKKSLDYKEIGGAPLLGITKPVIKSHGSANAYAFRSAIGQCVTYVKSGIIDDITRDIDMMKIEND